MSVDVLKTVAILETSEYLLGCERMAAATSAVGHSSGLERLGGGMTLAGGLMVGLGAKAIKTASDFQQMQMSLKRMSGSDALFNNLKKFTLDTPYTTSFWADQARMLQGFGVAADQVIPRLKMLGDTVTGAYGIDEGRLQRLVFASGEMEKGFANARHVNMFQRAGVSPYASIEKYLGLSENEIANIGKMHIPGKYVNAAIMKGMGDDARKQDAMEQHLHTLEGATHKVTEAWQMFTAQAGSGALEPVTKSVRWLADQIIRLSDPGASKGLGYLILYGGPAMLAAGPLVRAIGLWKQMEGAKKLAAIASNTERNAEIAKMPVLTAETAAVETATTRWGAFGDSVLGVAAKMGRFAVMAGKAYVAYAALNTVKELSEMHDPAQHDREQFKTDYAAFQRNRMASIGDSLANPGRTMTYGWKWATDQKGFARYQAEAARLIKADGSPEGMAAFQRSKPEIDDIIKNWSKVSDAHAIRMAEHLKTLVDNADAYKESGQGVLDAQQAASQKTNDDLLSQYHVGDYEKPKKQKKKKALSPSAAANPLDQEDIAEDRAETMMKIAGMRYKRTGAKADHDEYNAARKTTLSLIDGEIAGLERHAAAIEHVAGKARDWLSTEKKVQSLMEKHEELESDKLDKDKRDKLDKAVAQVLGGAGLSEDEILKRAGIGRAFFAGMGKGRPAQNPLAAALTQAAKRPLIVQVKIGDRTWLELKKEIVDDALLRQAQLARSSGRNTLFGSTN